MTIKMPPVKTANHMVNCLHEASGNMEEVSRRSGVPVNLLWTARKKHDYFFKTPYYYKGIKSLYMEQRGFEDFPEYIESMLYDLRCAYELANADGQSADATQLKGLLQRLWPLVDQKGNGDFSGAVDSASLHYLAGTMLLVADLRKFDLAELPDNKAQQAIAHFVAASDNLANPALRHRALISLVAARQRIRCADGEGFAALSDVLGTEELRFLQEVQSQQMGNSATDALNGLKLASALEMHQAVKEAEAALFEHDNRFTDPTFEGWSPISPVTEDPDLAFYRKIKAH